MLLDFYRQKSCFTDLGPYADFARSLPDDLKTLCLLQRRQIIHPVTIMTQQGETPYGNMDEVPEDRLVFENERFQTAPSILAELLRRDARYSAERATKDKLHLCCREQAVLLAAILKAKGIPARVRSGFAAYLATDGLYHDHWIAEWYDAAQKRWVLTDADCCMEPVSLDVYDLPRGEFLFGAQAYLALRKGELDEQKISYASIPPTYGMKAALRALFYDFHALMNDEIFFWHVPRYLAEQDMQPSSEELLELDALADLLLSPNENFEAIRALWTKEPKFRILSGGFN